MVHFEVTGDTLEATLKNDFLPVEFIFEDAKNYRNKEEATSKLIAKSADADAVLLDIRLPNGVDGLDILRGIRRHDVNLPVIIWTSSKDGELPADANLAHGYLFKKTVTLEQMASMLKHKLREGNAKRRFPIPGHFFDRSIFDRTNRKIALRFAEYGSKQLDSFHALDEQYFRFFTDHGGRHLIKLLEYLGNIIRPLVSDKSVFSDDESVCEEEILALYLAVFLHEFGMLRLLGKNEPDWGRMSEAETAKENGLVRNLHALRGMVMLADESCAHWPDEEGRYQAGKRFFPKVDARRHLAASVALVTGYHSRLLPLKTGEFCTWNTDIESELGKKAAKGLSASSEYEKIKMGLSRIESRFFAAGKSKAALDWCRQHFADDAARLERLSKHCAIFRFADAIDVDHTRNPADFLVLNQDVSAMDLRESLKRQVVRTVHVTGGDVSFYTCVPMPSLECLQEIMPDFAKSELSIDKPWDGEWDEARISSASNRQKEIDKLLEKFWKSPATFNGLGLKRLTNNYFDRDSKYLIASLTALSVAWEVLDEYLAIVQCGLQNAIKLHCFEWRDKCPHKKLQAMLSVLFRPEGLDRLCGPEPRPPA